MAKESVVSEHTPCHKAGTRQTLAPTGRANGCPRWGQTPAQDAVLSPGHFQRRVKGVRRLQHQLLAPRVISLHEDFIDTQGTEHNKSQSFTRVCSQQTLEKKNYGSSSVVCCECKSRSGNNAAQYGPYDSTQIHAQGAHSHTHSPMSFGNLIHSFTRKT